MGRGARHGLESCSGELSFSLKLADCVECFQWLCFGYTYIVLQLSHTTPDLRSR